MFLSKSILQVITSVRYIIEVKVLEREREKTRKKKERKRYTFALF
jgi:hypothetical protein